jgi:hypothetical protein
MSIPALLELDELARGARLCATTPAIDADGWGDSDLETADYLGDGEESRAIQAMIRACAMDSQRAIMARDWQGARDAAAEAEDLAALLRPCPYGSDR